MKVLTEVEVRTINIVYKLEKEGFKVEKDGSTGTAVRVMTQVEYGVVAEIIEKVWYGSSHIDYEYNLKINGEVLDRLIDCYLGDDVEYFLDETLMEKRGTITN